MDLLNSGPRNRKERKKPNKIALKDGTLFKYRQTATKVELRACAPASLKDDVLLSLHNDISAGHMGYRKTLDRIKKRLFWPRMAQDAYQYVRSVKCVCPRLSKRRG
jgi:hypothetical protein